MSNNTKIIEDISEGLDEIVVKVSAYCEVLTELNKPNIEALKKLDEVLTNYKNL